MIDRGCVSENTTHMILSPDVRSSDASETWHEHLFQRVTKAVVKLRASLGYPGPARWGNKAGCVAAPTVQHSKSQCPVSLWHGMARRRSRTQLFVSEEEAPDPARGPAG